MSGDVTLQVIQNPAIILAIPSTTPMVLNLYNGPPGVGVPVGGTTGQLLAKIDNTDYNTQWVNPPTSAVWGTISGNIEDQADLVASYVPYDNAIKDVNLGSWGIYAYSANFDYLAVIDIQLDCPGHYPSAGHIIGTSDGDFNITSAFWNNSEFVGFSANDGNVYFGTNPYNYGYGVAYGAAHILYVTADNSMYAPGAPALQVDGSQIINGNSGDYYVALTV